MNTPDAVLERSEPSNGHPARSAPATYRILVADDERAIVDAIRLLLASQDIDIVAASSPAEAMAAANAGHIDAAIVDLNYEKGRTNGEQGLELVSALRRLNPRIPIVVMTAWSSIDLAMDALRRGARDFIEKPWDDGRLVGLLRSHAELGRALRRVTELESEVQELRTTGTREGAALTAMRLLDVEGLLVRQAMDRHKGNVSRAARALGLSRSALYRRLERHKIQPYA